MRNTIETHRLGKTKLSDLLSFVAHPVGIARKRASQVYSEKPACPRRVNSTVVKAELNPCKTKRCGKAFCGFEEFERYLARYWNSRVGSESRETSRGDNEGMCMGQGRKCKIWAGKETLRMNAKRSKNRPCDRMLRSREEEHAYGVILHSFRVTHGQEDILESQKRLMVKSPRKKNT